MAHDSVSGSAPSSARPRVSRTLLLALWGLVLAGVLAAGALRSASPAPSPDPGTVARGKYLVSISGCNGCHTPLRVGAQGLEIDPSRMLSGHPERRPLPVPPAVAPGAPWSWSGAATATAFASAWGVSYAANLTPDQETGLGAWSEARFVQAMRAGHQAGPPMPWHGLAVMTDEDLRAVYAYLRSLPPIRNQVPGSVVADPLPLLAAGR
jgi:mono/diheme cytochrome c family protein